MQLVDCADAERTATPLSLRYVYSLSNLVIHALMRHKGNFKHDERESEVPVRSAKTIPTLIVGAAESERRVDFCAEMDCKQEGRR